MNTFPNFQRSSSIFLFITINVLFYFKYASRVSFPIGVVAVVGYLVFCLLLLRANKKKNIQIPDKWIMLIIGLFVLIAGVILCYIPKETLNVDRWEMIQLFWDSTFKGNYPYGVASPGGNYPGPMPFYFIICLPFYLIGEIGYTAIVGVLIWIGYIYRTDKKALSLTVVLLLSSLPIYWEIFARSTIFFNTCLFALFFFKLEQLEEKSGKHFFLLAVIGGSLFSTRNIFVIPLIIWAVYALRIEKIPFLRLLTWGICFIICFALTFLPFVLLNPTESLTMNPFVIQSTVLMPFSVVLCFVIAAVIVGFLCKKFNDVIYYSGLLLFITITGHVIYAIYENGMAGYLYAGADISYYLFSFPFLLKIMVSKPSV